MTIRETYNILKENKSEWGSISSIDGLKEFDVKYKLRFSEKRFFIGYSTSESKAFGIYRDMDTNNVIVYKNKDTGERKIRYEGKNEKAAVAIIKEKFEEELNNRIPSNAQKISSRKKIFGFIPVEQFCGGVIGAFVVLALSLLSHGRFKIYEAAFLALFAAIGCGAISGGIYSIFHTRKIGVNLFLIIWGMGFGITPIVLSVGFMLPDGSGYYTTYDNHIYYMLDDNWFFYDNSYDDWVESDWDYSTYGDYEDYYDGYYYDYEEFPFEDSQVYSDYYESNHTYSNSSSDYDSYSDWDNDWSSDDDWDSDWSSDDTDWGSDW